MEDLIKLLDGGVDDVKNGLADKSHDDLLKLKEAEQGGKARKGVLDAIDAAISAAEATRTGGVVQMDTATTVPAIAADLDTSAPANIAPAETVDTSGAPQQVVSDVDMSSPAVDANPRAGTTENMNRIDFNDPKLSGAELAERNSTAQN